ncbi:MAG: hypothetical protein CFE21_03945 [Bacteroidetes bacterium B1(2017)]|nr:MAG: hypothetical protein CFE21_03945 [Bacteroidetes bacterium B1(2017)]
MKKRRLLTYTNNIIVFLLLLFSFESCRKSNNGHINDIPPAPDLNLVIYNSNDSSLFLSINDSISLVFPQPDSKKPTQGHLAVWPEINGPYISCGSLIEYSAVQKIKTSLLFYNKVSIPDTLFVDFKTAPNPKGWEGYDFLPVQITLNRRVATQTKHPNFWILYK